MSVRYFSLPPKSTKYQYGQYEFDKSINGHQSFHKRNKFMHMKNLLEDIEVTWTYCLNTTPTSRYYRKYFTLTSLLLKTIIDVFANHKVIGGTNNLRQISNYKSRDRNISNFV